MPAADVSNWLRPGRGGQPGPAVLPRLRAGESPGADDPGLAGAGHWRQGDQPVLVVFDAGYDVTRLACLPADLPVELLGWLRSDRMMQLPRHRASPAWWAAP